MSPTTTPTIDLPTNKVRVVKPDPDTGEIIERVIPHKSLRPSPPKEPKEPQLDDRLITEVRRGEYIGPTGRSVIAMATHREALLDYREVQLPEYWAHFSNHLRRDEQRKLARGESSSVLRPVKPEWEVGDRMYVATDCEAEVLEVTESDRGFGTVFCIHDHRLRYLKRGVIGSEVPLVNDSGYAPELTDAEKRKAAIDSAYVQSSSKAVSDAGAVVDERVYEQIHLHRDSKNGLTRGHQRARVTEARLEARIKRERAKFRTSTVRHLERQLDSLRRKAA